MTGTGQSMWLRKDVAVIVLGGLTLALWDLAGLDLPIMRALGDGDGFPLQNAFVTERLMHEGGRWISYAVFIWLLVNAIRPLPLVPALSRAQRWGWLGVTALCLALIPGLKQLSLTSCPWDLAEFGGRAQYVSHWAVGVTDGGPGRCFPAGHPSGGFGFIAGYFALRLSSRRVAFGWLVSVVAIGLVFGFAQTLRGAHYPSHTLYTAWICWSFSAVMYQIADFAANRLGQRRKPATDSS